MNTDPKAKQLYARGLELAQEGHKEQALALIQEYLTFAPDDGNALNDAGTLLYALGRLDEAVGHLSQASERLKGSPEVLWNLAEVYLAADRPDQAMSIFPRMADAGLLTPDLANRTANCFLQQNDLAGATECLLTSLGLCPQQEVLLAMLENLRLHRAKIAFFCESRQFDFLDPITQYLGDRFQTKACQKYTESGIIDLMRWCDIAWFEWCTPQAIFATTLTRQKTCRIVIRLHRYEAYESWVTSVKWENVDALILVGNSVVLDQLRQQVPDIESRTRIITIPNGVDLDRCTFVPRQRGKNLAAVGYLNLRKNPMFLLHCFHKLRQADPQYQLHFAGAWQDDMLKQYMLHMIGKLGLTDSVFFHGHQKDIPGWLSDKHYLLSGSLGESQGMGIMESMACGLKPLIHDFPGADTIYDPSFLFATADEFVDQVIHQPYEPEKYRQWVQDNYPLNKQMLATNKLMVQLDPPKAAPALSLHL